MISLRIFSLLGALSIFISDCFGAVAWTGKCKEMTEGYDLTPDYDAKVPPDSLNVSLHTHIFDISEVDDFKQLVTIRFATSYAWKESRINFKKDSVYGKSLTGSVLNSVFVKNCLWYPGFKYLFVDGHHPETTYQLAPNKLITAEMEGKITITCDMDFNFYPFDKQMCYMQAVPKESLGIFTSNYLTPNLTTKRTMRILQYEVSTTQLNVTDNIFSPTQGLTVRIDLRRILKPHYTETFLPTALAVVISWVSLIMPPEVIPGRAGLLITLTLVITNILINLTKKCPRSTETNQMFVWVLACFGMITTALLEYALLLFFIRYNNLIHRKCTKVDGSEKIIEKRQTDNKAIVEAFSKKVDTCTLVVLLLTFGIFNCYYWSKNQTYLNLPFKPETNTYLTDAAYNVTLRIDVENFKGKPTTGADVSWCTDCKYPNVTYNMADGLSNDNTGPSDDSNASTEDPQWEDIQCPCGTGAESVEFKPKSPSGESDRQVVKQYKPFNCRTLQFKDTVQQIHYKCSGSAEWQPNLIPRIVQGEASKIWNIHLYKIESKRIEENDCTRPKTGVFTWTKIEESTASGSSMTIQNLTIHCPCGTGKDKVRILPCRDYDTQNETRTLKSSQATQKSFEKWENPFAQFKWQCGKDQKWMWPSPDIPVGEPSLEWKIKYTVESSGAHPDDRTCDDEWGKIEWEKLSP